MYKQKLRGILEYNEKTKLKLEDIIKMFEKKGYILITDKYINSKQSLEFICQKHRDLGIQNTTITRLRIVPHNCSKCQKEYNHNKMIRKLESINPKEVYQKVLNGELKAFPNGFFLYNTLEDLKEMISYYIKIARENENCDIKSLSSQQMFKKYKLAALLNHYSSYEIINIVYPNKYQVWELASCPPNYWTKKENIDLACKWFYKKLYEDNIIKADEEILNIKNYSSLFKKYKLEGMFYTVFNSSHYKFWNYLFPNRWFEWEFWMTPKHYWELRENRLKALKELIEYKLCLTKSEIPEKLTYSFLAKNYRKFSAICDVYYNSNLYQWINECYPNTFTEKDFFNTIGNDGTVLDSKDEVKIHNLLLENGLKIKYFENKISNMKNFYNRKFQEYYVPDWIINDEIIVEYYGWFNSYSYGRNEIITNYMDKTLRKNEFYKKLNGFQFIDLYPEDIENNFKGLIDKFNKIGIQIKVS